MNYLKNLFFILPLIIASCGVNKKDNPQPLQSEINLELTQELQNVLLKDQGIRALLDNNLTADKKAQLLSDMKISDKEVEGNKKYKLLREIDSINLVTVEKIIQKYGYPSKYIIGETANQAIFYVIQHSKKTDEYLPLIRKAAQNGVLTTVSLALMEDRNLMYKGLEQIYGTQIKGQANKKGDWIYFLWPIKNAGSINARRKKAGFKQTIEEYAKEMDVDFKLYKLHDIKNL